MIENAFQFREPLGKLQHAASIRVSPNFILTTILTANAIGMLFARSLHYQFYAYIALATPFLLWRSGLHPIVQYALWLAQEWSWNVYPSTNASSATVVGVLFIQVSSIWWGTRKDFFSPKGEGCAEKKKTI
jgi:alpha-1,3-mannosyltransferase